MRQHSSVQRGLSIWQQHRLTHCTGNGWFTRYMALVPTSALFVPPTPPVLPRMATKAYRYLRRGILERDNLSVVEGFATQYGWQVSNGALVLPHFDEACKLYSNQPFAVYLCACILKPNAASQKPDCVP